MYSGGNGTRRGRGIVLKWMDGRIVKEDRLRRGTRPVAPWIFRMTETSDEGRGSRAISLCVGGEGSRRSRVVGIEGRSQGDGDKGDSLELDQVNRRGGDGPIGGSEDSLTGVWKGEVFAPKGSDLFSRETENALRLGG